jgi:hypothetical protein
MDLDKLLQQSSVLARQGRPLVRLLIAAVIVVIAAVALLAVIWPETMSARLRFRVLWALVIGIGVLGPLFGLFWIGRIHGDFERDSGTWRYRDS